MRELVPALVLVVACGGAPGDDDDAPVDTDTDATADVVCPTAPATMHRVTRFAFDRALRDVLGIEGHPGEALPADVVAGGYATTSSGQGVGGAWLAQALRVTGDVVDEVLAVPTWRLAVEAEVQLPRADQIAISVGEPGIWIELKADTDVTVEVDIPTDGTYLVGIRGTPLIWHPGDDDGEPIGQWPTMSIAVDGIPTGDVTTLDTQVATGADWWVPVPLTAGRHFLRWTFDTWPSYRVQVDRLVVEEARRTFEERRTPLRDRVLVCDPTDDDACLDRILGSVGRRLWRRPLTADELDRLRAEVRAEEVLDDGLAVALHHLLASPRFLFLPEPGPAPRALDAWEVSARLADVLWASVPDDPLLDCAAAGGLGRDDAGPCGLDAQIDRMLADPRADAVLVEWAEAWLGVTGLADGRLVDPLAWGTSPALLDSMLDELHALVGDALARDLPPEALVDADQAFVDATLADHYGLPAPAGDAPAAVAAPGRGGVLRTAAVLLATSEPSRTSPVRRGVLVLDRLVCDPPDPPPPGVPLLPPDPDDPTAALDSHTSEPACAGCHAGIDPIGFALESFDSLGRARADLGAAPLPGPRELPDGTVLDEPDDLVAWVVGHEAYARCVTEQLATWALRRDVPADEAACLAAQAESRGATGLGGRLRALLAGDAFLTTGGAP